MADLDTVSFLTCSKISRISSIGAKHKVRYVSKKAHQLGPPDGFSSSGSIVQNKARRVGRSAPAGEQWQRTLREFEERTPSSR
jgi:hypothetical protein